MADLQAQIAVEEQGIFIVTLCTTQDNNVLQQDGAKPDPVELVQKFMGNNFDSFWPSDFWHPSSPALNPLE